MPSRKFVILAARRTGSNLLCTLLNSHPAVLCHHELFNPGGIYYALDHRGGALDLGTVASRDADPAGFLERVWAHAAGHECAGFKMTRGQGQAALEQVLADPGVAKIVLRRRNRVKAYVSERIAERTGRWEAYRGEPPAGDPPRVRVTLDELRANDRCNEDFYRHIHEALARTGQGCENVLYEDLLARSTQRRVLEHVGVSSPEIPLTPASVRTSPPDLREVVSNFDELDRTLRGLDLHVQLHDRGPAEG